MAEKDWQEELRAYFECLRVVERLKGETLTNFEHLCEFIAEPAFESLQQELKGRSLRSRIEIAKGRHCRFSVLFPKSRRIQFSYAIVLPKNSIELHPKLVLAGRRTKRAEPAVTEIDFHKELIHTQLLKLTKEDLILDFLERYKTFVYEAMTSPD